MSPTRAMTAGVVVLLALAAAHSVAFGAVEAIQCMCYPPPAPDNTSWLQFPADLSLHPASTYETVWFIGHVTAADGRTFGVLFMLALVGNTCPPAIQLAFAALADVNGTGTFLQQMAINDNVTSSASPLQVTAGPNWGVVQQPGSPSWEHMSLTGSGPEFSFDLSLDASVVPVQGMGVNGFYVLPTCMSAHIGQPRIAAKGTVSVGGGESVEVSGSVWYQHMWYAAPPAAGVKTVTGVYPPVDWHWFCAELSDGWSAQFVRFGGSQNNASYGNLVSPGGKFNYPLSASEFEITMWGNWTSPVTGTTFATRTLISVPSIPLTLYYATYLPDNEVVVNGPAQESFYEGVSRIWGSHLGQDVVGNGYTEHHPGSS